MLLHSHYPNPSHTFLSKKENLKKKESKGKTMGSEQNEIYCDCDLHFTVFYFVVHTTNKDK